MILQHASGTQVGRGWGGGGGYEVLCELGIWPMINSPFFLINLFSSIAPTTANLSVMSGTGLYPINFHGVETQAQSVLKSHLLLSAW